jgi:hypothetical protein
MDKYKGQFAISNWLHPNTGKKIQMLKQNTTLYSFNHWELKLKILKDFMLLIQPP